MDINWDGIAALAYEAYVAQKDRSGWAPEVRRCWEDLPGAEQGAWVKAAQAASDAMARAVFA